MLRRLGDQLFRKGRVRGRPPQLESTLGGGDEVAEGQRKYREREKQERRKFKLDMTLSGEDIINEI